MDWDLVIVEKKLSFHSLLSNKADRLKDLFLRRSFQNSDTSLCTLTPPLLTTTTQQPWHQKRPPLYRMLSRSSVLLSKVSELFVSWIKGGEIALTVKFSVLFREYKN